LEGYLNEEISFTPIGLLQLPTYDHTQIFWHMKSEFLKVEGLIKGFGGIKAINNLSCTIGQGEIVGLLGANGSGKTTLFNVITGFLRADSGKISFRDVNLLPLPPQQVSSIGIARTFQNIRLARQLTVIENVLLAFRCQPGEKFQNLLFNWQAIAKQEEKNRQIALALLETASLIDKQHYLVEDLSYGQQKLLTIVCCLATGADLLLLDEPLAGISPALIDQILPLIVNLPNQGKSVLLIEHNMDVVMQVCDRLIFMDAGTIICEGLPETVRNDPRVMQAYL
jgi:ABC-type branched-subunit amino acid transport system ATPase component